MTPKLRSRLKSRGVENLNSKKNTLNTKTKIPIPNRSDRKNWRNKTDRKNRRNI